MNERCHFCNCSDELVETLSLKAEEGRAVAANINEVIFVIEGVVRLTSLLTTDKVLVAGQIMFLPYYNNESHLYAVTNSSITIFKLKTTTTLGEEFLVEKYYSLKDFVIETSLTGTLFMNMSIQHFVLGINLLVKDNVHCQKIFELKIKEFFFLLKTYYSEEQICSFLYYIHSPDIIFSEYIRNNWYKYMTIRKLASSLNLSVSQFSRKFKRVFGETAYQWIIHSKAKLIYNELKTGTKPFKQIAWELGFSTIYHFNNFCKKELESNPTKIRKG